MMKSEFSILMVEDDVQDAELIQRQLRRNGLQFTCRQVCNREDFLKELTTRPPDIIFSDHGLPTFNGCEARALARRQRPEIPFVFVTGGIGELEPAEFLEKDTAYVLKSELSKLPVLVRRAIHREDPPKNTSPASGPPPVPEPLHPARWVNQMLELAIVLTDDAGNVISWNLGASRLLGYERDEIIGKPFATFFPWRAVERRFVEHLMDHAAREGGFKGDLLLLRRDSSQFWAEVSIHPLRTDADSAPAAYSIILHDLSERVQSVPHPTNRTAAKAFPDSTVREPPRPPVNRETAEPC